MFLKTIIFSFTKKPKSLKFDQNKKKEKSVIPCIYAFKNNEYFIEEKSDTCIL